MAHHNLYSSLGLNRQADSASLTADIDRQLAEVSPGDAAKRDELATAREIFSVPSRRAVYDEEISAPFGADVDVARIRQIAALPAGNSGSQGPQGMGPAGHSTSGVQLMPQSSNATGGSQFNVDLSSFSFPVEPSRQRCQSVQWCIVWGLLAFLWIISTLRGLGALLEVGSASGAELLFGADDYAEEASSAIAFFFMVAGGTPVYLMIAEFIWSLRKTLGRKKAPTA